MYIPDPGSEFFTSRIRIKELKYDFLPIPDPGVKKATDPGSATLIFIVKNEFSVKSEVEE